MIKWKLLCLSILLISCDPEKHDIDKGIAEMSEYREEEPVEDTVKTECVFDTGYYQLTMAALRGIPDVREITWIEKEHTAQFNWRGDFVRRSRGGCHHFGDGLELMTRDTTSLDNAAHWIKRAAQAAAHFGIPYYPAALAGNLIELDSSQSDKYLRTYQVYPKDQPENQALDGLKITRNENTTKIALHQYTN